MGSVATTIKFTEAVLGVDMARGERRDDPIRDRCMRCAMA